MPKDEIDANRVGRIGTYMRELNDDQSVTPQTPKGKGRGKPSSPHTSKSKTKKTTLEEFLEACNLQQHISNFDRISYNRRLQRDAEFFQQLEKRPQKEKQLKLTVDKDFVWQFEPDVMAGLKPFDITFGRGLIYASHVGNWLFRQAVALNTDFYKTRMFREDKQFAAGYLLLQFETFLHTRFIKQVDDGSGNWERVPLARVVEKFQQALRERTMSIHVVSPSLVSLLKQKNTKYRLDTIVPAMLSSQREAEKTRCLRKGNYSKSINSFSPDAMERKKRKRPLSVVTTTITAGPNHSDNPPTKRTTTGAAAAAASPAIQHALLSTPDHIGSSSAQPLGSKPHELSPRPSATTETTRNSTQKVRKSLWSGVSQSGQPVGLGTTGAAAPSPQPAGNAARQTSATVSLDSVIDGELLAGSTRTTPSTPTTPAGTKSEQKPLKKKKRTGEEAPMMKKKKVNGPDTPPPTTKVTTTTPRKKLPPRPYWVYPPIDPAYIKTADPDTTRAFVESHRFCVQHASNLMEQFGCMDMEVRPNGDAMAEQLARVLRPVKLRRLGNTRCPKNVVLPLPVFAGDERE